MIARLTNRKLVQIQAKSLSFDISGFLNSLVTNKVAQKSRHQKQTVTTSPLPDNSKLFSAAFLSPQVCSLLLNIDG